MDFYNIGELSEAFSSDCEVLIKNKMTWDHMQLLQRMATFQLAIAQQLAVISGHLGRIADSEVLKGMLVGSVENEKSKRR